MLQSAASRQFSNNGVEETIQIYARIRPCRRQSTLATFLKQFTVDSDVSGLSDGSKVPQLHFYLPRDISKGTINHSRETYDFWFDQVLDDKTTQDKVFDVVAKEVIDSCWLGYNGTIFAYGQTSSGKTFTMTGNPEKYSQRGLIPRTLQYIFSTIKQGDDSRQYQISVSYLEIYNEAGYDLIDGSREFKTIDDLSKVSLLEDENEALHLRNLKVHQVRTEEEALDLLFLGDTNKMMAETPSNISSSRSHCIFTVYISSQVPGESVIRKSKLHLVDLAGSERVYRTKIDGLTLSEAKYINRSLHFLEQVILSLQQGKSHVPYRNSMLTMILRDSLGGSCKTRMISTVAVEQDLIEESIATCRFAHRVAAIKNIVTVNEEVDLNVLISSLNARVKELEQEISILKGVKSYSQELTDYERSCIEDSVTEFMKNDNDDDLKITFADLRAVKHAFKYIKIRSTMNPSKDTEIKRLEQVIKEQRDLPAQARPKSVHGSSQTEVVIQAEGLVEEAQAIEKEEPIDKKKTPIEEFLMAYPDAKILLHQQQMVQRKNQELQDLSKQGHRLRDEVSAIKQDMQQLAVFQLTRSVPAELPQKYKTLTAAGLNVALVDFKTVITAKHAEFQTVTGKLTKCKTEAEYWSALFKQSRSKMQRAFQESTIVQTKPTPVDTSKLPADAREDAEAFFKALRGRKNR